MGKAKVAAKEAKEAESPWALGPLGQCFSLTNIFGVTLW
jgi:hypothetical protein